MTEIKDGKVYYTATITSFGDFVIGHEEFEIIQPVVEEVVISEPEEQLPVVVEESVVGNAIEEPSEVEAESGFFAWLKGLFN